MKLAGALIALASVATIVAFVLAVGSTKDDLPNDLRDCVTNGQAVVVHGAANLGGARADIAAKAVRRVRTARKGDATVVVLRGTRFRLLVLRTADSPAFEPDLAKQLYEHADTFPLVAIETDPVQGVLSGCASLVAG